MLLSLYSSIYHEGLHKPLIQMETSGFRVEYGDLELVMTALIYVILFVDCFLIFPQLLEQTLCPLNHELKMSASEAQAHCIVLMIQ